MDLHELMTADYDMNTNGKKLDKSDKVILNAIDQLVSLKYNMVDRKISRYIVSHIVRGYGMTQFHMSDDERTITLTFHSEYGEYNINKILTIKDGSLIWYFADEPKMIFHIGE
jgi:regulatory protein YycI of two-component signal transduction system YycFG